MEKINVLLVDDKEENLIALEALIQRDDIHIIKTISANDALKLAWDQSISLALIDVQMPNIDGFELAEMLKSNPRTKDILIIFVTAISKESKYAVKGLSTGAIDYLYKPLDPSTTLAKVDSFIQLAKAQRDIKNKNLALERYSVIIANSADLICVVDEESKKIEELNPAVSNILGFSVEELMNQCVYTLIEETSTVQFDAELEQLQNHREHTFEFQLKNKEGELVWTECRVTYKQKKYFFNISDHTLQKQYEQRLISSKEEAIEARMVKERFLANMSHELRTPLNGIIGIANLLKQTPLEESQRQMINLLELSSQSLLGVVNDILDLSKIASGKFSLMKKEINLHHLLRSAIQLMQVKADEKLLDLNLEIDENVPRYVETDPLRLNQILMNLLSNSIKFTQKGHVTLRAKVIEENGNVATVQFEVEDTGIGIQKERREKIFELYEQAEEDTSLKYGGTGLGLGIVKKLVEMQDGEIDFESEYGKGTTFSFTLQFKRIAHHEGQLIVKTDEKELLKPFVDLKALIAEDNKINQFIVAKVLAGWNIGYDVVEDGLEVLEKMKANDYDFILMDTYMPNLGGYDTTKRIRKEFDGEKKDVVIISMSAAVLEEEKKAALDAGMNYVLTKPFIPQDLYRIVATINQTIKGEL
ncbi:response regulator [Pseudopedobacter beijingensis]|uniref:histidine kinase n=1 Tax=Pseudopedobacter beijingensis TaxID=1207056 RepID=A0ABW4ID47_9SPHI